jgi:hypothetical protein
VKKTALLWCLLALALAGCKSTVTEASLVGTYKGEIKMPEASKDDPMAKMGEAMLGMLAGSLKLELKADHKFTLVMMLPISGDWSLSGNTVTLTPTTVMGLTFEEARKEQEKQQKAGGGTLMKTDDQDKPIQLQVSPDGKTLKGVDESSGPASKGELIFTKQGS